MNYTPRMIAAFVTIAADRRRRDLVEQFQIQTVAAQGGKDAIKSTLKELSDAG